jgi:hypothetical protein
MPSARSGASQDIDFDQASKMTLSERNDVRLARIISFQEVGVHFFIF